MNISQAPSKQADQRTSPLAIAPTKAPPKTIRHAAHNPPASAAPAPTSARSEQGHRQSDRPSFAEHLERRTVSNDRERHADAQKPANAHASNATEPTDTNNKDDQSTTPTDRSHDEPAPGDADASNAEPTRPSENDAEEQTNPSKTATADTPSEEPADHQGKDPAASAKKDRAATEAASADARPIAGERSQAPKARGDRPSTDQQTLQPNAPADHRPQATDDESHAARERNHAAPASEETSQPGKTNTPAHAGDADAPGKNAINTNTPTGTPRTGDAEATPASPNAAQRGAPQDADPPKPTRDADPQPSRAQDAEAAAKRADQRAATGDPQPAAPRAATPDPRAHAGPENNEKSPENAQRPAEKTRETRDARADQSAHAHSRAASADADLLNRDSHTGDQPGERREPRLRAGVSKQRSTQRAESDAAAARHAQFAPSADPAPGAQAKHASPLSQASPAAPGPQPSQNGALTESQQSALHKSVTRGLNAALNQRGGSLMMRLVPEALGQMRIAMTIEGGRVSVDLQTGNNTAHRALTSQLAGLRATLESRGFRVESLQATLHQSLARAGASGPESGGQAQQQNSQQQQQQQQNQNHAGSGASWREGGDAGDGRSRGYRDREEGEGGAARDGGAGGGGFGDRLGEAVERSAAVADGM